MEFDLQLLSFSFIAMFAIQVAFAYYIYVMSGIKDYKKSGFLVLYTTVTSGIILYFNNVYPENSMIVLGKLINLVGIQNILLIVIYKFKIIRCVIYSLIWAMILTVNSMFIHYIQTVLELTYLHVKGDIVANSMTHLAIFLMTFIILLMLKKILTTYKATKFIPAEIKSRAILINAGFLTFIVLVSTVNVQFILRVTDLVIVKYLFLFNFIVTVALLFFSIFNFKTFCNIENTNNELEHQKFYNENLQGFLSDVRSFKHNQNNLLAVMSGYKTLKKWDQLSRIIEEEVKKSSTISINDNLLSCEIKNAGLLGLISSKMKYSIEKDIPIQLCTSGKIDEVNIRMSLLCEVIGILLDNAIEAAIESPSKVVTLTTKNENDRIYFTIENSYVEELDIQKIFEKGNSSKGEGRGLGLWIVKERVCKNKRLLLNTSNESLLFKQELIVFNDNKM